MNEFVGSNSEWWYNGDGLHQNTERSTLLLLDRKEDCLSPLIHEFTYEAMVNDLLPIDDDRITYDSVNAGTAKEGGEGTTKMLLATSSPSRWPGRLYHSTISGTIAPIPWNTSGYRAIHNHHLQSTIAHSNWRFSLPCGHRLASMLP